MKLKTLITCSLLLFLNTTKAQYAVNVGYGYFKTNAFYLGGDMNFNDNKEVIATNLGLAVFVATLDNKTVVLPEIHFNTTIPKIYFLMPNLSLTTKNVMPSLGLNLLNGIHIKAGYSKSFDKKLLDNGFYFGINLFLGDRDFYTKFKTFGI